MFSAIWTWLQAQWPSLQIMYGMFLLGGFFEYLIPAIHVPVRHYAFNLAYATINTFVAALVAPLPALGMVTLIQATGAGYIDLSGMGFGGVAGAVVAVVIGTLVFDFFYYWLHRTQHSSAILWQEHLLHHSDEHVNVTTSGRTHILEQFLFPAFISIPMAFLFQLPAVTIVTIAMLPTYWAYLVHANVRVSFGPLWWLFASPQYHRVHHSIEPQHHDKNFAVWFPIWDIIFGTAVRPKPGEYPATGVAGERVNGLIDAYLLPFRKWSGMLRDWRGRTPIAKPEEIAASE